MNFLRGGIEELTGAVGVGSLLMLSFFLSLDAWLNIVPLIERYAKGAAWAAFMALPVLVVSYVAGLVAISIGGVFRKSMSKSDISEWDRIDRVEKRNSEIITARYGEMIRRRAVFEGSVIAFLALAVGAFAETRILGRWEMAGYITGGLSIAMSAVVFVLANRVERDFDVLLERDGGS